MLRGFFLIFLLVGLAMFAFLGLRGGQTTKPPIEIFPDMDRQPKIRAQATFDFFADGRGPRPPVPGTVPIGYEMPRPPEDAKAAPGMESPFRPDLGFSVGNDYLHTGKMGSNWGTGIPVPVTSELMQRGQERFNINCAVCHGANAKGNGIAKQYGLATVVTLQDQRIRQMSDGEIFNTITHGKGTMYPYGGRIVVQDRWAIIAYLRALQRGQNATIDDIPPEQQGSLQKKQ